MPIDMHSHYYGGLVEDLRKRTHRPYVAADELGLRELLRQDRVLHRAEQRRLDAAEEERGQEDRQAFHEEPRGADHHDAKLKCDSNGDETGFFVLVRDLAGGGGEQQERQDEERLREVLQRVRGHRANSPGTSITIYRTGYSAHAKYRQSYC